ncbi:MAG: hypothetical protein IPK13_14620 [Deltaproteobacteria bacterium]|nr:hypothetical protein [Deltaproteobacteria bacterium]
MEAGGYCCSSSSRAAPYPQAAVHIWPNDGLYLIAVGGGGGAAQLMPSAVLTPCIEAARKSLPPAPKVPASERLTSLFEGIDKCIGEVILGSRTGRAGSQRSGAEETAKASHGSGPYAGSGAYVVGCAREVGSPNENQTLWFDNVGLGRAYSVLPHALVALTVDDAVEPSPTGPETERRPLPSLYSRITTSALNGRWVSHRHGDRRTPVAYHADKDAALGFILITEVVRRAVAPTILREETTTALATPDLQEAARRLWARLRDRWIADGGHGDGDLADSSEGRREGRRIEYDRCGALLLLRPRIPGSRSAVRSLGMTEPEW